MASDTVTITASFSEAMNPNPRISISGSSISNQVMTKLSSIATNTQIGGDINGKANEERLGEGRGAVMLSSNGNRLIVGAPKTDVNGNNRGLALSLIHI